MSEAIKTISLDDVGGLQGQGNNAPKSANVMYNPQYGGGEEFKTAATAGSDLDQSAGGQSLGPLEDSSFGTSITRMTELFGRFEGTSNTRNYIIVGALVLALAAALYLTSGDGTESPLSSLLSQFDSLTGQSSETPADESVPESAPTTAAPREVAPTPQAAAPKAAPPADLVNPYWSLPNPLDATPGPATTDALTPSQEERWRQGLAHPFVWQRHKTVAEMRSARLKGSQYLLNDALAQPKFWTRMEALIALAEMGEPVDIDTVESAIGSARRSLIQNYFRRFLQTTTAGELYVMRQAVRIVDAGTRKVILENLIKRRDSINELYLVAATLDPNARINSWIQQELIAKPLVSNAKERFQQAASGMDIAPPAAPGTPPSTTKVQDLKVEELKDDVNVEEVYFLKDEDKQERKVAPADDGFNQLEQKTP